MVGITEEYGANAQAESEEINEKNTLGRATKYPGHSMVQVVMANILDPLFEISGLPSDHPEYSYVGHIENKNPENQ